MLSPILDGAASSTGLSENGDDGKVEHVGQRRPSRASVKPACRMVVEHDPGWE
jgi:hypothetical protein